jgi:hypothetical protein
MSDRDDTKLKSLTTQKKLQIICKFWMMGNCTKGEKCIYLHKESENIPFQNVPFNQRSQLNQSAITQAEVDCPMYSLGFCKNGPMCKFSHKKKQTEDFETLPELPIRYLEYIFEKPINIIFQEFEENNQEETMKIKEQYFGHEGNDIEMQGTYMNKHNKFYQNKKSNSNNKLPNIGNNNPNRYSQYYGYGYQHDIYLHKKNSILDILNLKVRYFFVRSKNMNYVKFAMENNILILNNSPQILIKYNEAKKSSDEVILIIFDDNEKNFTGYAKFKKDIIAGEQETQLISNLSSEYSLDLAEISTLPAIRIEWLWKTKLSYTKVELLKNPLNDNEIFINSRDGQEIAIDIAYYVCRLMIKRLTKEEVREYIENKKLHDENTSNCKDSVSSGGEIQDHSTQNHTSKVINIKSLQQNLNLNSIIYDEINKQSIPNSKPHTQIQTSNNSIIVTNISNLQVNISQNSYNCNKEDERKLRKREKRKRSHSREYESGNSSDATVKKDEKQFISKKRNNEYELEHRNDFRKDYGNNGFRKDNRNDYRPDYRNYRKDFFRADYRDNNRNDNKSYNSQQGYRNNHRNDNRKEIRSEYESREEYHKDYSQDKTPVNSEKRVSDTIPLKEEKKSLEFTNVKNKLFSNAMRNITSNYQKAQNKYTK